MYFMKKNDIINLDIVDIGNNGEGIAKKDNLVIFIPFALLNENVETLILKVNKNIAFGKILKINKPSELRINAPCPYFMKCGGCDLQHIKYSEQLKFKTNTVKTALHKYADIDFPVDDCFSTNKIFNYRNKMQYPCSNGKIGMYAPNSHRLIDIEYCALSMPLCHKAYTVFRDFCKQSNSSMYNEETHTGIIRNVLFREIDSCVAICVIINNNTLPNSNLLIELLKKEFNENFSLFININKQHTNVILSNKTICLYGQNYLSTYDFNVKYYISPNSFLQVNREIQNEIYSRVLKEITNNSTVINTYSGAGLLTAIIAKKAKFVYGIEIIDVATKNANELITENNIHNVKNITGDCSAELPKIINNVKIDDTIVVLDPPRKGCSLEVVKALNESEPNKIIYISCNPATLARDLKLLKNKYSIKSISPFDMFPQTKHIETLVCLEKNNKLTKLKAPIY